jgi:hypothetical protein
MSGALVYGINRLARFVVERILSPSGIGFIGKSHKGYQASPLVAGQSPNRRQWRLGHRHATVYEVEGLWRFPPVWSVTTLVLSPTRRVWVGLTLQDK